jgi:hypothetical protein
MAHQVQIFATAGAPVAYDQCDALTEASLSVTLPYPSFNPPSIKYDTQVYHVLCDETSQGVPGALTYMMEHCLETVWQGTVNNPLWLMLSGSVHKDPPMLLEPGENVIVNLHPFNRVDFEFTEVGPGVDYWWGSYSFAKLGVFMTGAAARTMPVVFLNSPVCSVPTHIGNTYTCILQPGCRAIAQTANPVEIPRLAWSHFGGSGLYPTASRSPW